MAADVLALARRRRRRREPDAREAVAAFVGASPFAALLHLEIVALADGREPSARSGCRRIDEGADHSR